MENNHTCGECQYYEHPIGQCLKVIEYNNCHITDEACEYFEREVITNGDKIRQMSNEELNKFLTSFSLQGCKYCAYSQVDGDFVLCQKTKNNCCVDGLMDWLNSPAESEGGDE